MAINSFKSNALEPTRTELRQLPPSVRAMRLLPVYGLVILTVLLALFFSLLLPATFPTLLNARSIISDKSIIAILSLAAMIPMVTGKIDLTIGYGIVLWHILVISLQEWFGVPWPVAVVIVLCLGAVVGLFNGLLVEVAQIDSFIATLGTGTMLYAIAMWHSQGHQIMGALPNGFLAISGARLFGLPITGFYVLVLAGALWFILEYLPIGRYFYAIGANPKAAALNGIPVRPLYGSGFRRIRRADRRCGRHPRLQAARRTGERRPRVSASRARRRLPRIDDDQARTVQRVGNAGRRHHPGDRHFRHPATRRRILGRAVLQRRDPDPRDRHRGLYAAPARQRSTFFAGPNHPRRNAAAGTRRKRTMKRLSLFATVALAAVVVAGAARADDFMEAAKARVAAAIKRSGAWDGPTTGPAAAHNKTIVYVAGDLRNGGTSGVADGVKEAAAAIGWKLQVIDGQGQVSTRTAALNQAVALKPDGIIVSGFDAIEQNAALAAVKDAGIPFVGWHATIAPGPDPATGMFANVNTRILDVANTAADLAIVDSGGKAGVVIFGDSNYAMAIGKAKMMEAEIKKCGGCTVLSLEDSPMTEASLRMPQLTTSLLQRYGDKWTYTLAVNDLYYDFMGPSLASAGKAGTDAPHNISAGDGSESAFAADSRQAVPDGHRA